MAEWKTRALELLPALRPAIEADWSCHVFLGELLPLVWEAHRVADEEALRRIYGFVRWCFDQPGQFLTNAAMVSFYELVFDEWELRHEIAARLPKHIIDKVRPLWEWRLPTMRMAEIDRLLTERDDATDTTVPAIGDVG